MGNALLAWRSRMGLTQAEASRRLGVSQTYVSLMEDGRRPVGAALRERLRLSGGTGRPAVTAGTDWFVVQLARLGYPGFSHFRARGRRPAPDRLLRAALTARDLDARVSAALPWLARKYSAEVNWRWLSEEARLHDFQNRLGFLMDLAEEENPRDSYVEVKRGLERSRLLMEATFCWDSMPDAVRAWMRSNRTAAAERWNVLSRLTRQEIDNENTAAG